MEKNSKNKQSKPASILKYSGLAFQMLATIALGAFLGKYLDNKFSTGSIFTAVFSLLFVFISFYFLYKETQKK